MIYIRPKRVYIAICFFKGFLRAERKDAPNLVHDGAILIVTLSWVSHLLVAYFLLDRLKLYALPTFQILLLIACQVDKVWSFRDGLPHR